MTIVIQKLTALLSAIILWVMPAMPDWFIWIIARRYVAGQTREDALAKARELFQYHGFRSTIDILGEHITEWAEAEVNLIEYKALVRAVAGLEYVRGISIKLSAIGQFLDDPARFERIVTELLTLAKESNVFVRFDMEDATTVDSTLGVYVAMRERGFNNIGVVLQTRLNRTRYDLEKLGRDWKADVRLCIGIYVENDGIALTDKAGMKDRLVIQMQQGWSDGQHIAVASHDRQVVEAMFVRARHKSRPFKKLEVQHLLGVPVRELQLEVVRMGAMMTIYVPYGQSWRAYCQRRIQANPNMVWMIIGDFFKGRGN